MLLARNLTDSATITNYTEGDPSGPFNNPTQIATESDPVPALSQPQTSTEVTDQRDTTVTRRELFLAPGAPISATSTVVLASMPGVTWQVIGDPSQFAGLGGRASHIQAVIQKISG